MKDTIKILEFVEIKDRKNVLDDIDTFLALGCIRDYYFRYVTQDGKKGHSQRILKINLPEKQIIAANREVYTFSNSFSSKPTLKKI